MRAIVNQETANPSAKNSSASLRGWMSLTLAGNSAALTSIDENHIRQPSTKTIDDPQHQIIDATAGISGN
jgi:hypothetical protein